MEIILKEYENARFQRTSVVNDKRVIRKQTKEYSWKKNIVSVHILVAKVAFALITKKDSILC